jgi:hypothetical protein
MVSFSFFLVLQLCDAATTLIFLHHGVGEANPLVATALRVVVSPGLALALIKLCGCGLGLYAWKSERLRLLRRANLFFAACVAWNLVALVRA